MKLLLMLLLLALELTLVCVHAEGETSPMGKNFNPKKIEGKWYSIGLASDKREMIEEDGSMRVFVEDIHVFGNSSLAFKFHTKINGECTGLYLVCDETEKDGEYFVEYDGYNKFTILGTDYDGYIIFHLRNVNNGETFQLMELYGRKQDLSSKIKEKFVELCKKHGIVEENILDLTEAVDLVPERVLVPTLQIAVSRPEMEERPEFPVSSGDSSPGPQHHPSPSTHRPVTSSVI
ncbi:major urinary protein 4-like [Peromyscus californicus insignis]|uniref:major urinary protein 4-like n=1 Tax=Peromyscus californicus insignis TaxID=564181 RepID=UPI0022A69B9E|nr:major urinary protein 4-like [Peromyscus californicus insignis]